MDVVGTYGSFAPSRKDLAMGKSPTLKNSNE